MAQIVPEGSIAAEVADIRLIPSEVAAEATVPTGGVAADAPRIVDQVEADAPAIPVSDVTVVLSSQTTAGANAPSGPDSRVRIMRGGYLNRPLLLSGTELTTALETSELVLQGGHLTEPVLMTDLEDIDGRKFFSVVKWNPALCQFLTGKRPKSSPLSRTHIFETMRKRVKAVRASREKHIRESLNGPVCAIAKAAADSSMRRVCKDATHTGARKRSHHAPKCSAMLPRYWVVPMNVGTPLWAPTCLLSPLYTNAAMEATPENFKALFDIVQSELASSDATPRRPGGAHSSFWKKPPTCQLGRTNASV